MRVLGTMNAGEIFGEISFLDKRGASASVLASSDGNNLPYAPVWYCESLVYFGAPRCMCACVFCIRLLKL